MRRTRFQPAALLLLLPGLAMFSAACGHVAASAPVSVSRTVSVSPTPSSELAATAALDLSGRWAIKADGQPSKGGVIITKGRAGYSLTEIDPWGRPSAPKLAKLIDGEPRVTWRWRELPVPQNPGLYGTFEDSMELMSYRLRDDALQVGWGRSLTGGQAFWMARVDTIPLAKGAVLQRRPTHVALPPRPAFLRDGTITKLADRRIAEGIYSLQLGIAWYAALNHRLPGISEVRPKGALGTFVDPWPSLATGSFPPMHPGSRPGDYGYSAAGSSYVLAGHLMSGRVVTVRGRLKA